MGGLYSSAVTQAIQGYANPDYQWDSVRTEAVKQVADVSVDPEMKALQERERALLISFGVFASLTLLGGILAGTAGRQIGPNGEMGFAFFTVLMAGVAGTTGPWYAETRGRHADRRQEAHRVTEAIRDTVFAIRPQIKPVEIQG